MCQSTNEKKQIHMKKDIESGVKECLHPFSDCLQMVTFGPLFTSASVLMVHRKILCLSINPF